MSRIKKVILLSVGVIVVLVLAGCGHISMKKIDDSEASSISPMFEAKKKAEELAQMAQDRQTQMMMEAFSLEAPMIELEDVTGGNTTGAAWIAVVDGKTFHRTTGKNMPQLKNGEFYEGWLVKQPVAGGFFSTGKMFFDEVADEWVLNYEANGDKSEYRSVVITLEPDDGNPAPAKHIIEGRFDNSVNFKIN